MNQAERTISPIAQNLFEQVGGGQIALIGGCDTRTGQIAFPRPADDKRFEKVLLPREGTLWSFTIQRFRPKSPPYRGAEAFEPYAVGYVALGETIIVEGRLAGCRFEDLAIGMPMRVGPQAFTTAEGEVLSTFAFYPIDPEQDA